MAAKDDLGRYGEQVAVEHLQADGLTVLARNWRFGRGELDVVARHPDGTLVVAEVKTRSTDAFGLPAEAVDHRKAARVRALAVAWLSQDRGAHPEVRFDVVSVLVQHGRTQVAHLPGAF